MTTKYHRQTILINKAFQSRLIIQFAAVNAILLMFFAALFFMFIDSEIASNLAKAHAKMQTFSGLLFPIILTLTLIQVLLSTVMISLVVLYASHRIAGPVYRFQKVLQDLIKRNLDQTWHLRKEDQFKLLSEDLSTLTHQLNQDFSKAQDLANKALSISSDDTQRNHLEALSQLLATYKTRSEPENNQD